MAQTFTGRKRVRKFFGHIREVADMPNLIEVQKASYDQFLMVDEPKGGRADEGLQAVFKSVFPISDFAGTALLEFVKYEFEPPKYDVDECRQRGMTFAAPLKVTLRLIVFDVDPDTGAKSVKDIKEQDVYMGDMPFMTSNGTFIVNGTERVIVSQMHRSPGVFFDHDKGKSHSSGKLLFAARIIPYRGSWLDIEFDAKDIVYARIDRRRKIPATSLLYALGLDGEEILSHLLQEDRLSRARRTAGACLSTRDRLKGTKAAVDIIDADTGEVVVEAGKKLTARAARQLAETRREVHPRRRTRIFTASISPRICSIRKPAKSSPKPAKKSPPRSLETLLEPRLRRTADARHRPHQHRPLYPQHAGCRQEQLARRSPVRHLPRDASRRAADHRFGGSDVPFAVLRFGALRSLGRRPREDEHASRPRLRRTRRASCAAKTFSRWCKALVDLRDGRGEIDDIDHLGNRRVRSVGELMENQYRLGLLRMERAIKERMSSVDIDTVMPQDLINAKPAAAAVREFFGSSQLSQFMDQTNPLSEITHKRRLSALGPGGLTRERAGFEVRDVHPTHYGRICPIETPEGPNIGLINSLATFARVNKYGFIEAPYRRVKDGSVTDEVVYLSAMEEGKYSVAQANAAARRRGQR